MIRKLEVEEGTGKNKTIVEVKQLGSKEVAVKDVSKKTYEHFCYHDEGKGRPCKRVEVK